MPPDPLELTADLGDLAQLATRPARLDELLAHALDYLAEIVPYDLAAVLELRGDELVVRCARGPLANDKVRSHAIALEDFPSVRQALETRRARVMTEHDHADGDGDPYDGVLDLPHGHACLVVPLFANDRTIGALTFDRSQCVLYEPLTVNIATITGQIISLAMFAARQAEALARQRDRLAEENRLLAAELPAGGDDAGALLTGSLDPAMRRVVAQARQVAVTDAPVLIGGETGTGKEVLARALHGWSRRAARPFIRLNCAALPDELVESELFGHRQGAFSGAVADRPGRFVVADGGTILLDEVGELPLAAQAKLLRVLQEGSFEPVGSDRPVSVDVRVIAATNVDLQRAVAEKRFREDLYFRLAVFPIHLPPLRERGADLLPLAEHGLARLAARGRGGPWRLSTAARAQLAAYPWPGNVRELLNCLERATILQPVGELGPEHLHLPALRAAPAAPAAMRPVATIADAQREAIRKALEQSGGRIYGAGGAAELLGMKPSTLQSRMIRLSAPPRTGVGTDISVNTDRPVRKSGGKKAKRGRHRG
jgi:transcriptional regulator with GAF, ATPase, and Fis domain